SLNEWREDGRVGTGREAEGLLPLQFQQLEPGFQFNGRLTSRQRVWPERTEDACTHAVLIVRHPDIVPLQGLGNLLVQPGRLEVPWTPPTPWLHLLSSFNRVVEHIQALDQARPELHWIPSQQGNCVGDLVPCRLILGEVGKLLSEFSGGRLQL